MINPDATHNPSILRGVLEARRTERDARIQEATLRPEAGLSASEVALQTSWYNDAVAALDQLKNGEVGDLRTLSNRQFCSLFPDIDREELEDATRRRPRDNPKALALRAEYRHRVHEAQRHRKQALQSGSSGRHVTVEQPASDGCVITIVVDTETPARVTVRHRHPDGSARTLTQDGTTIRDERTDAGGHTTTLAFYLDAAGRPVGEYQNGELVVTAHDDGSTVTRPGRAEDPSPDTEVPLDPWRTQPECPCTFDISFGIRP